MDRNERPQGIWSAEEEGWAQLGSFQVKQNESEKQKRNKTSVKKASSSAWDTYQPFLIFTDGLLVLVFLLCSLQLFLSSQISAWEVLAELYSLSPLLLPARQSATWEAPQSRTQRPPTDRCPASLIAVFVSFAFLPPFSWPLPHPHLQASL